ncbi:uncharacterized protein IL334_003559 [Kwoniella shivajii]|uniref:Zn(2)-C6 fungal-type domain-containing protein n=1 Tax=Kwoniella shivajii TaxID=564305 RepID=A0ABZ1CY74_9TREE|nr:hypothetical protein IL334_003559 [Kwoniella shivajii]
MSPISASRSHGTNDIDCSNRSKRDAHHKNGKSKAIVQPLRRGDACLMCRAKKLKCSAQKPMCDQCAKRKDRCVYDAARPASRVEQLERKLAEMDEADFREALARRTSLGLSGFDSPTKNLSFSSAQALGQDNGMPSFSGYDMMDPVSTQVRQPAELPASPTSVAHILNVDTEPLVDINDILPSLFSWPNILGTTSQIDHYGSESSNIPHYAQSHNQLFWPFLGGATSDSFLFSGSSSNEGIYDNSIISTASTSAASSRSQSQELVASYISPQHANVSPSIPELSNLTFSTSDETNTLDISARCHTPRPEPRSLTSDQQIDSTISQGGTEMNQAAGSQFPTALEVVESVTRLKKAADLNAQIIGERELCEAARGYLLDLFFSPHRHITECGSEFLSKEEFITRLSLPEGQSPHPCLQFSMYTVASSSSYVPSIRRLAEPLFQMTISKLDEAIRKQDRLLDAIKASKTLSKWLFAQSRPLEGYLYSNKSVSLCMACGLHQIPSSVYSVQQHQAKPVKTNTLLSPPQNQQELGERIHSFWSTWGNERGGSLTHHWPSAIEDESITTPLPRPKEDYHNLEIMMSQPDITLRDLYNLPYQEKATPLRSLYAYLLVSEHLNYRATKLAAQSPAGISSSYRFLAQLGSHSTASVPREHYPAAYKEIMDTSYWLENNMPEDWKFQFLHDPSWIEPDIPIIGLCLKASRMHLHPIQSEIDRPIGLNIAFECSSIIKSIISYSQAQSSLPTSPSPESNTNSPSTNVNQDAESLDSKIRSTRDNDGLSGPYALTPSFGVVKKLLEGYQVFKGLGRLDEATRCKIEAQSIYDGFKSLNTNRSLLLNHIKQLEELFDM